MIKKLLIALLFCNIGFSQVVINELDADTFSTDVLEFIELKSSTPNFSLNGYVLVFFNGGSTGTGNASYMAYDLDGITTDINGIATIGDSQVSPVPNRYFANDNIIQNGPDAVGLYLGNGTDFPTNSVASTTNLIDALVYSNSASTQASTLKTALGITVQYNENANGLKDTQSIQRKVDGTYEVKAPTPGANNDGSGVVMNGLSVALSPTGDLSEPNPFTITFTTQNPVSGSDLNFTYTLANGNFTTSDYSGSLSVTIPVGSTTAVKNISLIDDAVNEGDETMRVVLGIVPSNYSVLTNNIDVRVHDNDYIVKPWGTPIHPTYGLCPSTRPVGYYDTLEGKSGAALKQAIQDIIANPAVVREHTYADVYEMLMDTDSNPENDGQVWLMYVEQPRSKIDVQTGVSNVGKWNREHIYCQSRGAFNLDSSAPNDGINVWTSTDANDITAGGSDVHHIRAEDGPENSSRNNRNYGVDYNGPTGSLGSWHGDVARAIFYMAVRYNGLNVVNGDVAETPTGYIGDLATLLTWNHADPADDFEMNHNNVVFTWQKNRNPFVDYPDLADYVFGVKYGQVWSAALSAQSFDYANISLYPNPSNTGEIAIGGLTNDVDLEVYSITGSKVYQRKQYHNNETLSLGLTSGIYMVKIIDDNKSIMRKLVIE